MNSYELAYYVQINNIRVSGPTKVWRAWCEDWSWCALFRCHCTIPAIWNIPLKSVVKRKSWSCLNNTVIHMQGNLVPECLSRKKPNCTNLTSFFSAGLSRDLEKELASIKRIDVEVFLVPVESLWIIVK